MIADIAAAAGQTGLEIHPDKTKIIHNLSHRKPKSQTEHTEIKGMNIQILPYDGTQKYLGRALTFKSPTNAELTNRISAAWRKFNVFKEELTNKAYSQTCRLRLFN